MLDEWELGGGHPSLDLGAGAGVGGRGSPGGDLFALDHRAGALSRGLGVTVAFTVVNDTLFVATSRNFLLRHDLSDDGGGGEWACRQEGRYFGSCLSSSLCLLPCTTSPQPPLLATPAHPASPVVELEATKSSDARVRRLFVDPLGRHALLALQTPAGKGRGA